MPWGSLPAQAAEISALIVGPLLLLVSIMLTTRGGPLNQPRVAHPNRVAAGLGSVGMAIFLAGGLVVGLSAAAHPEREASVPGARFTAPEPATIALAVIPPAAVLPPAIPPAAVLPSVTTAPAAAATAAEMAANLPLAAPAAAPDAVLKPGGALLKRRVAETSVPRGSPATDVRPPAANGAPRKRSP